MKAIAPVMTIASSEMIVIGSTRSESFDSGMFLKAMPIMRRSIIQIVPAKNMIVSTCVPSMMFHMKSDSWSWCDQD